MEKNFKELLHDVRCFVFDIDGVLTDGSLMVQSDGTMLRRMNIKDGYALRLAAQKNYEIFIISGSKQDGSAARLKNLGIEHVFTGVENKLAQLENLMLRTRTRPDEILYMGDDMPDLDVMKICGLRTCPADAVHQIKSICQYVSPFKGGEGCVRDVIEQVLTLRGEWS
jgi:3-deoxy-D-manno-octulosonate 8-phosphate phosphatase (KDO 8-P phosphatase)